MKKTRSKKSRDTVPLSRKASLSTGSNHKPGLGSLCSTAFQPASNTVFFFPFCDCNACSVFFICLFHFSSSVFARFRTRSRRCLRWPPTWRPRQPGEHSGPPSTPPHVLGKIGAQIQRRHWISSQHNKSVLFAVIIVNTVEEHC